MDHTLEVVFAIIVLIVFAIIFIGIPVALFRFLWRKGSKK